MENHAQGKPGNTLRRARLAQGLRLRQTARLADLDAGHLSRMETDERPVSMQALVKLAPILGLGPVEFAQLLAEAREKASAATTSADPSEALPSGEGSSP